MQIRSQTSSESPDSANASAPAAPAPVDVFYVVQSKGVGGQRDHCLRSDLYESRTQAHVELARLQATDNVGSYDVWKSATYVEPAEWLHRVVRRDGTLILPRLNGLEKGSSTPANDAMRPPS